MPSFYKFAKAFSVLGILGVVLGYLLHASGGSTQRIFAAVSAAEREWTVDLDAGRVVEGSPAVHDIDGDGFDEIIVGTTGQGSAPALAVLEHTGNVKWRRPLDDWMQSTPTVADISSPPDGIPEIIITTGGDPSQEGNPGAAIAYDRNGNKLWEFLTDGSEPADKPHGNFSTPQVGDVDNDGDMEILFGSWDRNIYMLDHNGNSVWHYHVADTVWSTGILLDLDGDGDLEFMIGTDITNGGTLPDGYQPTDGGLILILDRDGNLIARRQINETIYSSIAAADVDSDGDYEFFVGTGHTFYNQGQVTQPFVYGFHVDMTPEAPLGFGLVWEIEDLPGWPQPVAYPGMSSPGLANLDDDADLEVFIGTGQDGGGEGCTDDVSDPDCHGALYAWNHDGASLPGFPMWPKESNGKNWFVRSSPTAGDVDNDGEMEILLSIGWEVIIVGSDGGQEEAIHSDYSLFNSPTLGDIDNDGRTNVISAGSSISNNGQNGTVYNFELGPGTFNADNLAWPSFHRDARNSGIIEIVGMDVSPNLIFAAYDRNNGTDIETFLTIAGTGTNAAFDWELATPAGVSADQTSGTVSSGSADTVNLTIETAGLQEGLNNLGNVVVTTDSSQVSPSRIEIPISVLYGDITQIYLPLIK